ncbi:RNA-metabolising metallo-beta-lactamase [compost metagenome]
MGYQAKGTPGAVIQASEGAEGFVQIDLDGHMYEVRAKVMTLSGYSGHADQKGLVSFATRGASLAVNILLVHGDPNAKAALSQALMTASLAFKHKVEVSIPR